MPRRRSATSNIPRSRSRTSTTASARRHIAQPGQARLFSRTLDEVTGSFPELVGPLSDFAEDVILDGEIVAWRDNEEGGHAMPFGEIQKRLGRKQVSQKLIGEVPVAYVVFDVIYAGGELTLDKPLSERVADPRPRLCRSQARGAAAGRQFTGQPDVRAGDRRGRGVGLGAARARHCVPTPPSNWKATSTRRWRAATKA